MNAKRAVDSSLATNDISKPKQKSLREQVINHVAKYSLASLVGGVGGFFSSYFGALLLGPSVWGIWQEAKLILLYGTNLHLGIQNGMHRELPILRGKKDLTQQAIITDVTFTFSFAVALLVSLSILFSTFTIGMGPELKLGLRFVAAMVFLQYIYSFYGSLFRANNEFDIVSWITLIDGIGNGLSIALIFPFGFAGFLAGQVLRLLIATAFSLWKSSYTVNWHWDSRTFKSLVLIGFPIMLMIFANEIFTTIDRLLILKFLDVRSLGFYSLGNIVSAPLVLIFTAINSVMYPRFTEQYGETGDPCSLRRHIIVPIEIMSPVLAVLVGVIYIVLPLLVRVFLPAYVAGVPAAQILMFGLFFYGITGMAGNMLLTINKQVLRLLIILVSALFNLIFSYAALRLGYGMAGVAVGTSLAYFIFFVISITVAMKYCLVSLNQSVKFIGKALGFICYVGGVLWFVSQLSLNLIMGPIAQTFTQELVLLALCGYPFYVLVKKTEITSLFRKH